MSIKSKMDDIKNFDCDPGIYQVTLQAASYITGYNAYAEFRSPNQCNSVSSKGATPEEALDLLYNTLLLRFSKCPTCGAYRHLEENN